MLGREFEIAVLLVEVRGDRFAPRDVFVDLGQCRQSCGRAAGLLEELRERHGDASKILPEAQKRKVGDTVWMAPKERFGPIHVEARTPDE